MLNGRPPDRPYSPARFEIHLKKNDMIFRPIIDFENLRPTFNIGNRIWLGCRGDPAVALLNGMRQ